MGKLIRISLVAVVVLPLTGFADDCVSDWLDVEEIKHDNDVELHARNLAAYPVTYTLHVRTHDYRVHGPSTVTRTLGPHETERVMRLDGDEGGGKGFYRYSCKWTVGRKDANHDDDHLYALPFASGRSYRILQGYGSRFSHKGYEEFAVDFEMREGTPVHAARSGVVARVEESHDHGCWEDDCGQYANYIVILHTDGTTGEYYHLKQDGAFVEVGDSVARGQKIGLSGNTGHSTMPHLHFAVYRATEWGRTQSIPVRFQGAEGMIDRPRRGARPAAQ